MYMFPTNETNKDKIIDIRHVHIRHIPLNETNLRQYFSGSNGTFVRTGSLRLRKNVRITAVEGKMFVHVACLENRIWSVCAFKLYK